MFLYGLFLPLSLSHIHAYCTCCRRGGGQRVWFPLQGHGWLCYLSHSWVVLTPAWDREVEAHDMGRIFTAEWVIEGERCWTIWREFQKGKLESLWLSFRSVFSYWVYYRSSCMASCGGLMSSGPPCGASSRCVYHCSPLSSAAGDRGVKYSRSPMDPSTLHPFLHKAQSPLETPWHFEF